MSRSCAYLWLACTKDKYELPVFIEDSCIKLAKKVGVNHSLISHYAIREKATKQYIIRRVSVNEQYN